MSASEVAGYDLSLSQDCPQQDNGFDCGVFVCMYALCLVYKLPITTFKQEDVQFFRRHIALCIRNNALANFATYTGTKPKMKVPQKVLSAHQAALAAKTTPLQNRTRSKRKEIQQQEANKKLQEHTTLKAKQRKPEKPMIIQDPSCADDVQVHSPICALYERVGVFQAHVLFRLCCGLYKRAGVFQAHVLFRLCCGLYKRAGVFQAHLCPV